MIIRYMAERGIGENIEHKWFKSLDELENSGFDYDYYHKMEVLETHPSDRYKAEQREIGKQRRNHGRSNK